MDCKQFIAEFAEKLKRNGFSDFWNMSGCSKSEIKRIEEKYGYCLPEIYREFLLKMVRKAGNFYRGTDIFYGQEITGFNNYLREILKYDKSEFVLPENAFVFAHHQGYIYFFFYVTESENPSVYGYMEEDLLPKKISESFSEFLLTSLKEQKGLRESS